MALNSEIIEIKPQASLSVRTRTSHQNLPETIGKSYEAIQKHINVTGAKCTGDPFVFYYNMDMNDLDVEIGFPVEKEHEGAGDIKSSKIPGGKVIMFTHVGPYSDLGITYNEIMAYINENKVETTGVVCESYPNDPAATPPAKLRTDIKFYLKD